MLSLICASGSGALAVYFAVEGSSILAAFNAFACIFNLGALLYKKA